MPVSDVLQSYRQDAPNKGHSNESCSCDRMELSLQIALLVLQPHLAVISRQHEVMERPVASARTTCLQFAKKSISQRKVFLLLARDLCKTYHPLNSHLYTFRRMYIFDQKMLLEVTF